MIEIFASTTKYRETGTPANQTNQNITSGYLLKKFLKISRPLAKMTKDKIRINPPNYKIYISRIYTFIIKMFKSLVVYKHCIACFSIKDKQMYGVYKQKYKLSAIKRIITRTFVFWNWILTLGLFILHELQGPVVV